MFSSTLKMKIMKTITQLILEGYNTTGKLEEVMKESNRTIQRLLSDLVESGGIVREGSGPSTFYRVLKATPQPMEIIDKMRLVHQQKSMDRNYRKLDREIKSDLLLTWYIDNFPGMVEDYDEKKHQKSIYEAIIQLEKEL